MLKRETYATVVDDLRSEFFARCWERGEVPSDEAWQAELRREARCYLAFAHRLLREAVGERDGCDAEHQASDEILEMVNDGPPFRWSPICWLPDEFYARWEASGDDYSWTPAIRGREEHLRTMDYRSYLKTPEWEQRKRWALHRAGHACQTCGQGGRLHVHHRTYERRGEENVDDLIVLCEDCHLAVHTSGGSHRPAGRTG